MYRFSPTERDIGKSDAKVDGVTEGIYGSGGGGASGKHPLELKLERDLMDTCRDGSPGEDGMTGTGQVPIVVTSPSVSESVSLPGVTSGILCLKWNGFQDHLLEFLLSIFQSEELSDVTLVADSGEIVKAHKIVLALSSPYFRKLFQENPCKHPIVILQGIKYEEVQQVMHFIYTGQVRVREKEFDDFMEAAESLRIDGINANPSNFSDGPGTPPATEAHSPVMSNMPWSFPFTTTGQGQFPGLLPDEFMTGSGSGGSRESALLRKRSSTSSGISTGTNGSINEQFGASCSPPPPPLSLQRPFPPVDPHRGLRKILRTEPGAGSEPVLIEIDDEAQSRWHSPPSPWSEHFPLNYSPHRRFYPAEIHTSTNPKRRNQDSEGLSTAAAEDLSKSNSHPHRDRHSPETSYERTDATRFRTSTGLVITTPPILTPTSRNERRSTSWPLETTPPRPQATSPNTTLGELLSTMPSTKNIPPGHQRYFPFLQSLASNLPRPIPHNPLYFPTATVTQAANLPAFSFPQHGRLSIPSFRSIQEISPRAEWHQAGCPFKRAATSAVSPPRVSPREGEPGRASSPNSYRKFVTGIVPNPVRFTKPKTKAIRSSQVPQSARYTASQVDSMVEKVENFPGPLVPCIVCQKFVKRERLRAHIHECHLLPREKIECPICKIGLKSKGSYRVHLWRHRRSKTGTDLKVSPTKSGLRGVTRMEGQGQSSSSSATSSWAPTTGGPLRSPATRSPEGHHQWSPEAHQRSPQAHQRSPPAHHQKSPEAQHQRSPPLSHRVRRHSPQGQSETGGGADGGPSDER